MSRRQWDRKRQTHAALLAALALGWTAVDAGSMHAASLERHPGLPSAVIVDQLAFNSPNASFAAQASALLEGQGYVVDYVPWKNATLSFYQDLPRYGYDVILLRSHSTATGLRGNMTSVTIFAGEEATGTALRSAQQMPGYRMVRYNGDDATYLAFNDQFVRHAMRGDFDGALVLMMGCEGLKVPALADAFRDRGAAAYVGWDRNVTADETDAATLRLLETRLAPAGLHYAGPAGHALENGTGHPDLHVFA